LPDGSLTVRYNGDDRFVVEITAEPGFSPTPHIHNRDEELFYVLDGHLEFLIDDRLVHADPGTFLTVPPGVLHDFRNPGPATATLLGIATPGSGFGDYFAELSRQWTTGDLTPDSLRSLRLDAGTDGVERKWHDAAHEC
jgi:mannose-6-phosphate isomerase-like protein (cupin superfamily)